MLEPKTDVFKKIINPSIDLEERAEAQIRQLTRVAIEKGIGVRWYSCEQKYGITIYDSQESAKPNSDKAWCIYEQHDVLMLREDRPKSIVKKSCDTKQFSLI